MIRLDIKQHFSYFCSKHTCNLRVRVTIEAFLRITQNATKGDGFIELVASLYSIIHYVTSTQDLCF